MENTTGYTEGYIKQNGLNIFYRRYIADSEKALLVIAHGLGEHSGRYVNVVKRLVPKGITVYAPDFRGHGKSDGKRGHVLSFGEYLEDLYSMIETVLREKKQNIKLFLLGHSMGGLIAINYAISRQETIGGLIISSPSLGVAVKVPAIKAVLGKVMSSLWPELSLSNEIDASKISHDDEIVAAYKNDPLVHDRVTARWFTEFLSAMEKANKEAQKIKVPVLMQIAGDDHLVNSDSSKSFFNRLDVKDKTIHVYDDLYHEGYNEAEEDRKKVLNDLEAWISSHI
ncbi:MAG: alpha/beta hydrolase [Desulfobacteraceae bacterium]|nr:MAG: alpha/beta hydrolase [Desulfobacteraceae bacterium]